MRRDSWDEWELQVLYDLVNELHWFERAQKCLHRRSENAIKTKMSNLRAECGIVPGIGPSAMSNAHARRTASAKASHRLLDALLKMEAA